MLDAVIAVVAGYFLGSLPFAYLVTRLVTGKDIRLEGDGNVGTRNVIQVAGLAPGLLTFALDAGKGVVAGMLAQRWTQGTLALCLAGVALLLGHGYRVWLGWHGGKGLAPAAGFFLALWPCAMVIALAILLVARTQVRHYNVAVAIAAAAFVPLSLWEGNDLGGAGLIVTLLGMAGVKHILDVPHERSPGTKGKPVSGGSS